MTSEKPRSYDVSNAARLSILTRDEERVRQRYMRLSKPDLVNRLLVVERTYAEQRERWLSQQDEVLTRRLRAEAAETHLQDFKAKVCC